MKPQREEVPKVLTPTILIIARKKVLCKAVTSIETRETNYVLVNYSWNHVSYYFLKVPAMGRRTNTSLPVQQQTKATSCSGYQSLPHNCWPLGEPLPEKAKEEVRGIPKYFNQVTPSFHSLSPPHCAHTLFSINQSNFLMKTCGKESEKISDEETKENNRKASWAGQN